MFYVDSSGSHGLEAKAADEANTFPWDAAVAAAADNAYGPGWRLPTKDELELLYQQRTVVGGFASYIYWSDFEFNSYYARCVDFRNGYPDDRDKTFDYRVRAVRDF